MKEKGVEIIACIASNDPYVMSAWGKANHIMNDDIVCYISLLSHIYLTSYQGTYTNTRSNEKFFLCDPGLQFSKKLGWTSGDRTMRYALIIEKDGTISYAEKETTQEVTVSSAEAVLAKL